MEYVDVTHSVTHSPTIIRSVTAGKKRRGNHEGSVYQEGARSGDGTGRWIAQVMVDGKKRRAIADTEAKAKQRLRQMQSQIEHGTRITDGNLTVQQVLDQWTAKALPNRNLQQPTLEVHRWAREILIADIGGKRARNLLPRRRRSRLPTTCRRRTLPQLADQTPIHPVPSTRLGRSAADSSPPTSPRSSNSPPTPAAHNLADR